jgi:hypothetical protein
MAELLELDVSCTRPALRQKLTATGKPQAPDLSHAQANIQAASSKAGAYLSSWGAWASEKKKGWGGPKSPLGPPATPTTSSLAKPSPGDIKRAEEFKREKDGQAYNVPMNSARTAPPNVEAGATNRESVFFDAEKEEREKEKGRSKEAENVG